MATGTYDDPKVWQVGLAIIKGDIFQVTEAQAAIYSYAYQAGDFYQARYNFTIVDESYPYRENSDSQWQWQGSKWSHAKHWVGGSVVIKGDIFQVTEAQAAIYPYAYQAGDFYQALYNFTIVDESYPYRENSNNTWQWQGDKLAHPATWAIGLEVEKGDIFLIRVGDEGGGTIGSYYQATNNFIIGADDKYPDRESDNHNWQWIDSRWHHAKHWVSGLAIIKGDIFRVTAAEAEQSPNYQAGAFYLALKDGVVGDVSYPASGTSNSQWQWQGEKWYHTFRWVEGLAVKKGDIFQVTEAQAAGSSGTYQAGDFYEALKDGVVGDDNIYPDSGNSDSQWQWQGDKWFHPKYWASNLLVGVGDIFQVRVGDGAEYWVYFQATYNGYIDGNRAYPAAEGSNSNWIRQGNKWAHPGLWVPGLEVKKGKVFQVQSGFEIASASGVDGDYYEARRDFTIQEGDKYPPEAQAGGNANWEWLGDKFYSPRHWSVGLEVRQNEIFQVVAGDMGGGNAGDYYEAKQHIESLDSSDKFPGITGDDNWQWQGDKWFHPKVWTRGDDFKSGDIFQVEWTHYGVSTASAGYSGDYYVAVKDFTCDIDTRFPDRETSDENSQWQGTKWYHPARWLVGLSVSKYDIFQVQDGDPGDGKKGYYYEAQSAFIIGDATEKYPDPAAVPANSIWLWQGDAWDHPHHWMNNLEVVAGDIFQVQDNTATESGGTVGEYYKAKFTGKITSSSRYGNAQWILDDPNDSAIHSDFINPKHWQPAAAVKQGDIFQVTAADIARQPSNKLVVGDYYEALFTGDIYNANYPHPHTANDYWQWRAAKDDWRFTENVGVTFADVSTTEPRSIYANGIHMVRVNVHFDALNAHKDIIKNPTWQDLSSAIQLINYSTGQPLLYTRNYVPTAGSGNNNSGWCYSDGHNDYADVDMVQIKDESASEVISSIESGNAGEAGGLGQTVVTYYVFAQNLTASDGKLSITVSARITLPQNPEADISGTGGSVLRQVQLKVIENPIFIQENIGVFSTNSGSWSPSSESTLDSIDQDNYYLHIQGVVGDEVKYSPVLKYAEIHTAFFSSDNTLDHVSSYLNGRCWSYKSYQYDSWLTTHMSQYYHCIWPFDPTTKKYDVSIPIFSGYGSHRTTGFVTMSHGGEYQYPAVCLTRLSYHYAPGIGGGTSLAYDCHVLLYDQYGNSFWVTVIRNTNSGNSLTFVPGRSTSNP